MKKFFARVICSFLLVVMFSGFVFPSVGVLTSFVSVAHAECSRRSDIGIAIKNGFVYPGDKNFVAVVSLRGKKFNLKKCSWTSSDRRVVRIVKGWPVAVAPGKAVLTLRYKGKKVDKINVGVVDSSRLMKHR